MTYEDYEQARDLISKKAIALMHHEKKNYAWSGFPMANYFVSKQVDRAYYAVSTNIFRDVLQTDLLKAQKLYPLNFGNNNAKSVLYAIIKTANLFGGFRSAMQQLHTENCCWIIENKGGKVSDKTLRLDLFRQLKEHPHKKGKYEFVGGVLHAFKHFSYKGKSLSTGNDINDLQNPWNIVIVISKAFFECNGKLEKDGTTYVTQMQLSPTHYLECVFYYERITDVFFLKTLIKKKYKAIKG